MIFPILSPLLAHAEESAGAAELTTPPPASSSQIGGTSDEEAALLLKEGRKAFAAQRYERAIARLQRLVDRYPGFPGYLEAHLWLGQSYLGLGQPTKALPGLQYYVQGTRDAESIFEGKVWLARAYLQAARYQEAFLTTTEVETIESVPPSLRLLGQQNALIKSRALRSLGRLAESREALASARKFSATNAPQATALAGETAAVELELKLAECATLPSPGPLAEDQARNQYERRGTCLLEALPGYRALLLVANAQETGAATEAVEKAFRAYRQASMAPPEPTETQPTPRTDGQRNAYHRELGERLLADFRQKLAIALRVLTETPELPQSVASPIAPPSTSPRESVSRPAPPASGAPPAVTQSSSAAINRLRASLEKLK